MAWDKSKPVTNSALLSAEIRANWDALDAALVAPLTALATNQVLLKGAGPVLAGVPAGTNGWVLTLVGGVPVWQAPTGGGGGVSMVPLDLDRARFPDGTANNAFPQPVERVSTGTPLQSYIPKPVALVYQFDGTVNEWLMWKITIPMDYGLGNNVELVVKWSMLSVMTGNVGVFCRFVVVDEATSDVRALQLREIASGTDNIPVPTTLGRQKETRFILDPAAGWAAGRVAIVALTLGPATTSNATGDRVLEAAWLEFAR